MSPQYFVAVNRWFNGKLKQEIIEFFFYEDAFRHVDGLDDFDSLKVTDCLGIVIHEKRHHHHHDSYA